jgi:chemotaxis protein MotB
MKKQLFKLVFISLIAFGLGTSCVSSKKFAASEAQVNALQKKDSISKHRAEEYKAQVNELENEKIVLLNKNELCESDLKRLAAGSNVIIADQATRLRNMQQIAQTQKDVLAQLKSSIEDALINYKTDELSVYAKDGNVYVSLEEKLLFKSGSDVVDKKGKEAIKTLAKVLNSTTDITVMIEGHADSTAISNSKFKDNWDLSTARATNIVRVLVNDNGFDPKRITASGKGKYAPVKSNETAEGRASNRRTEIILTPDLNELFRLLYQ